ncbi:MAG TPA: DUF4097 family beta strand repeat-containing protein [Conexibacter sp.]|nr:DUF4097 family beta strand repeat-containing protein [Conexibacter sp.]
MPRTSRNGLSKPFIVVGVLVGAFCVAYAALFLAAMTVHREDSTTQTYSDVRHLRVKGGEGDITVIAEARDDVQVVARREWSLAEPEIKQGFDEDGKLTLSGSCGFVGSIGPSGCETDFELRVPLDLTLDVRGSSGDVTARGLAADAYLCTSSGDLRAIDVTGPLRVAVSSGDVTVEGYGGRTVSAHGSSGDVVVRTRAVPDRVEAVTSSGDVTVAVPGTATYDVVTDTSSGDQSVDVDQSRDAPRRIDARTSSGDVRVVRLGDAR